MYTLDVAMVVVGVPTTTMFESYMRLTELYKESQSRLSSKIDELEAMKQYLNEVLEEVDKLKKTK
jgi:hypothetical protein